MNAAIRTGWSSGAITTGEPDRAAEILEVRSDGSQPYPRQVGWLRTRRAVLSGSDGRDLEHVKQRRKRTACKPDEKHRHE